VPKYLPYVVTAADNPIQLVAKLRVGGLWTTTTLDNGVVLGTISYVDPVTAANWIEGTTPTAEESRALRALQYSADANRWCISINSPRRQVEFIDNPLDYIDGFILDYGIRDDQLIACLFGKDGLAADSPVYKPMATMPWAMYTTNTQVEKQWEDLPDDLPTRDGYKDYHGFMFGLRSGLVNHPEGTGWQKGRASNVNNWNWTWKTPTYTNRWDPPAP